MHRCVGSLGDGIVMVKGFRIYAEYFFSFIIFSTFQLDVLLIGRDQAEIKKVQTLGGVQPARQKTKPCLTIIIVSVGV